MSEQKMKKEEYRNVGGLNTKTSIYVTEEREVLDLLNYDLTVDNCWTQRPGVTGGMTILFGGVGTTFAVSSSYQTNMVGQASQFVSVFQGSPTDNTTVDFFGTSENRIYEFSGNFVEIMFQGRTTADFGITSGYKSWHFRQYFNYLFYCDGDRYVYKRNLNYNGYSTYLNGFVGLTGSGNAVGHSTTASPNNFTGTYNLAWSFEDNFNYIGAYNPSLGFSTNTGSGTIDTLNIFIRVADYQRSVKDFGGDRLIIWRDRVPGFSTDQLVPVGAYNASFASFGGGDFGASVVLGIQVGGVQPSGNAVPLIYTNVPSSDDTTSYLGRFIEVFSDRLWTAGTFEELLQTVDPSRITFSEAGFPEQVLAENFINVQNGKFFPTGMRNFNQSLIIFCQKGVYRLTGDSPQNFQNQLIESQYGSLNHKCIVEFKNKLWFLDDKQLIEFNGANFTNEVGDEINGFLSRMNTKIAIKIATGYHYEERKEVWLSFPIDDSTENNLTLVYNYDTKGWSRFQGFNANALGEVYQGVSGSLLYDKKLYMGDRGLTMGFFDTSFPTDFGNMMTLMFQSRFHAEEGHSNTSQYRRFYLDTNYFGATLKFDVQMIADFATLTASATQAIYRTSSLYSGRQQTRIDFGIPAKALSFKVTTGVTTGPQVQAFGYTVEFRHQRSV